jgi:hypothetical protein
MLKKSIKNEGKKRRTFAAARLASPLSVASELARASSRDLILISRSSTCIRVSVVDPE